MLNCIKEIFKNNETKNLLESKKTTVYCLVNTKNILIKHCKKFLFSDFVIVNVYPFIAIKEKPKTIPNNYALIELNSIPSFLDLEKLNFIKKEEKERYKGLVLIDSFLTFKVKKMKICSNQKQHYILEFVKEKK